MAVALLVVFERMLSTDAIVAFFVCFDFFAVAVEVHVWVVEDAVVVVIQVGGVLYSRTQYVQQVMRMHMKDRSGDDVVLRSLDGTLEAVLWPAHSRCS